MEAGQKKKGVHQNSLTRVLEVLRKADKPITKTAVCKLAAMHYYQACLSLDWLCSSGLAEKIVTDDHVLYQAVEVGCHA